MAKGNYNKKAYDPKTYVKKSGCSTKQSVTKNGEQKQVTYGWKATRFGMMKYFAAPCKHTKKAKSESGKVWYMGVAVTVTNQDTGVKNFYFGAMEASTGRVIIKDLGIVLNPKGGRGGVVAVIGKKG